MVACKFSLICLVAVICVTIVRCNSTENNPCGEQIPCDNSRCIPRNEWCDGFTDCFDETDEKYCKKKSWLTYSVVDNNCSDEIHFTCNNRMCIPIALKCDGIDDCKDNSDEKKCGDSSQTGATIGQSPPNGSDRPIDSSSTPPAEPLPSADPLRSTTAGYPVITQTDDYYDNRWAEGGNAQRPPYNPPDATASAHPPVHAPDPTPDSRIPPGNHERSFANLGRQPGPDYPVHGLPLPPPTQEPCDKTISGADDDPATHYRVPWSHFTFQSRHQFHYEARRAQGWLMAQRDAMSIWGENTPRALVALALSSDAAANLAADDIMQRRLRIDLGAKLIRWREERGILSTSGLALYINALLATCQNPRNLLERDLVEMLYHEVQGEKAEGVRDASPFPYLTLCLVDRALTEDDRRFLLDIAGRNVTDEISRDRFILATSALACLKKTLPYDRELGQSVDEAFQKLQQQQLNDGSFGSVYSTALAAQALIAIDSQSWNPQSTLNHLLSKQLDDGSFGDFLATYYALPVLNGKCLLHLRNIHCPASDKPDRPPTGPELPPIPPSVQPEITKTIHYRLVSAIRNPPETLDSLDLVVPQNDNFFNIMKRAQEKKHRFRFLSVELDKKIDVYQIDGTPNDPEFGKFWILYEMVRARDRPELRRYTQDIRDLIPKHSDELLFYYEQFKPGYP